MYKSYFKRILDLIATLVLLLLFSPKILIYFILVLIFNKGNALFFQVRLGVSKSAFY